MSLKDRALKYRDSLELKGLTGSNIKEKITISTLDDKATNYLFFQEDTIRTRNIDFGTGRTNAEHIYSIFKIKTLNETFKFIDSCTTISLKDSMKHTHNSNCYNNSNSILLKIEENQLQAKIKHGCKQASKTKSECKCKETTQPYFIPVKRVEIQYFDDQTGKLNKSEIETEIKRMFCSAFNILDDLKNYVTVSPIKKPEGLKPLSQDVPKGSVLTSTIKQRIQTLKNYKAIILEGVPGTGKTYGIGKFVEHWTSQTGRKVKGKASGNYAITMHPSTSYEDFVEGLRPNTDGKNTNTFFHTLNKSKKKEAKKSEGFSYQDGFFKRICKEAANDSDHDYLILLDEFNRCNIPKVMGDLLTTLESSKRVPVEDITDSGLKEKHKYQTITLPYSKEIFFVPDNVYVIGTMNTTDRSVAPLDSALRRRFAFIRVWPMGFDPSNEQSLDAINKEIVSTSLSPVAKDHMRHSIQLYHDINSVLKEHGQDVLIGHSYLYDLQRFLEDVKSEDDYLEITKMVWNQSIFPQLIDSLRKNNLLKLLDKDEKTDNRKKLLPVLQGHIAIKRSGSGFQNIPTLLLENLPQVETATSPVEKKNDETL